MKMPIIDLSSREGIDWSQPQPFGTWRCDRGYETDGYQCLCLQRATTEVNGENLCTEHALIETLDRIRCELAESREAAQETAERLGDIDASLATVSDALWDIGRTLLPFWRRWYRSLRARRWAKRQTDKTQRRPWGKEMPDSSPAPEMMPESELRGLDQ